MKEYIKKFESASSADNYAINDIPFTTSIATNPIQNIRCNQENKKLVNTAGVVTVEDAPQLYTLTWNTEGFAYWYDTPSQAAAGETISVGYNVDAAGQAYISINDGEIITTDTDEGIFTFTMPAQNTTVLLIGGGG